tara:strand:+ start:98 stop:283 length:186 start_codon:yes stop_codon:yes gene_type:complete
VDNGLLWWLQLWWQMSFIKNTKEYDDIFILPEGVLENLPSVAFEDQSKDFEDDDCGDSCKL